MPNTSAKSRFRIAASAARRWFGPLDFALLITALLMRTTDLTVLFFHFIFIWLALGAFFWPFRAFALRSGFWVLLTAIEVANAILTGRTQVDELIEIPLLSVILVVVFAIASRRAAVHTALVASLVEREVLSDQLAHQATHDALTGLPNRAYFLQRLDEALTLAAPQGKTLAVLFLDLDGFKHVNDSLGHAIGDRLLVAVAERLRCCLRPEDTVSRLGGDEFTMLLDGLFDVAGATRVAERITTALATPFALAGHEVTITTSIGVACNTAASGYQPADNLLRDADLAMYRAKAGGKARHEVFTATMHTQVLSRLELEDDLRHALAHEEFVVHYQPRVDFATGRIVGTEALVRWQHPRRGLLFPDDFIPLAEETGMIVPLGQWVLIEACRQTRAWQERYPDLTIHVNLSVRQFQHPDLVEDVTRALVAAHLDPASLTLEITESVLMGETATLVVILRRLKGLGLQLAIDDFGTGYSSLSYLKRFPVDTLKIDKSFVDGLGRDPEDTAIVQAVITLAETLGLAVAAEGVENAKQLEQLRALGCSQGQGYYFAKALPRAAIEEMFDDLDVIVSRVATTPDLTSVPRAAIG